MLFFIEHNQGNDALCQTITKSVVDMNLCVLEVSSRTAGALSDSETIFNTAKRLLRR